MLSNLLIYLQSQSVFNQMENKEIRLTNLLALIAEAGGRTELAERVGTNPNYLTQITTRHRSVGNPLARKLEHGMRKPAGWIDNVHEDVTPIAAPFTRRVPLIEWDTLTRRGVPASRQKTAGEWVLTDATINGQAFAVRVRGDAMQNPAGFPTYPEGSRIIVDPERAPVHRDRVLVRVKGGVLFRQLLCEGQQTWLKPLNPAYPATLMSGEADVIGVVVQTIIDG